MWEARRDTDILMGHFRGQELSTSGLEWLEMYKLKYRVNSVIQDKCN